MELDRTLEALRTALPLCYVVRTSSPTYIRSHTGYVEDIILVNIKGKPITTSASQKNSNDDEIKEQISEELELTGSPLKLDLSLRNILEESSALDETQHWVREELTHLPTSLENARYAANLYVQLTREMEKDQLVPLWVVTAGTDEKRTMLLSTRSYKNHFDRGIVTYEGEMALDEISFEKLTQSDVQLRVECKMRVADTCYPGYTRLHCEWSECTLEVPLHSAKVTLEQEVTVGHERSPCHSLWKSICALNSINRALVDMTAAGYAAVNLADVDIRPKCKRPITLLENSKRLTDLLNEVESYTYTAVSQKGGCICIPDDVTSLTQCLVAMEAKGSSNDFTYKLWDILRDSETADDVLTLLLTALKAVSSGKMKPFITPSNKTYLSKLVLKLSRGHSQTSSVLKNLRANPPQALSLVGQLGVEKNTWELTHLFTLVDNSFAVDNVLSTVRRSNETIEQINQTIHDMTMGCGDMSLNPFENKSLIDNSIRINSESLLDDDTNELSIDNFASLKKHGLVASDKRTANEVPLILDEIDVSGWKTMLTKFAQLFVCLEHLNRMQQCLRLDMGSIESRYSGLRDYYMCDESPVKTVSQLLSEPAQSYASSTSAAPLREHLNNKLASYYLVHLSRKPSDKKVLLEEVTTTHVFSQHPVFPPTIWRAMEAENEPNETTLQSSSSIKYHHTKYVHLSTSILTRLHFENNKAI